MSCEAGWAISVEETMRGRKVLLVRVGAEMRSEFLITAGQRMTLTEDFFDRSLPVSLSLSDQLALETRP
jgi:hypothetical protein